MSYPNGGPDLSDPRLLDLYIPVIRLLWPAVLEATHHGPVSPEMLLSLAWEESGFEPDALSPTGGEGLFSMTPAQAQSLASELGTSRPNLCHPATAMHLASRYLRQLLGQYDDIACALVAFHWGPEVLDAQGEALMDHPDTAAFLRRVFSTTAWLTQAQPWRRPLSGHAATTHAYQALLRRRPRAGGP
jgi:soluble lytic murein transglycosylase-like protein